MRLVHVTDGAVVVSFEGEDHKPHFTQPYLTKEFERKGIEIPQALVGQFHGKEVVRLNDPEFFEAFRDIWVKQKLNTRSTAGNEEYRWEE